MHYHSVGVTTSNIQNIYPIWLNIYFLSNPADLSIKRTPEPGSALLSIHFPVEEQVPGQEQSLLQKKV